MTGCRVCGCTDERACAGGCSWVEADLCSVCADAMLEAGEALMSLPQWTVLTVYRTDAGWAVSLSAQTAGLGDTFALALAAAGRTS